MENKQILLNSIQCLDCKDILISYHVHDFKFCSCKSIAIDGGSQYGKRIGALDRYKELSKYDDGKHSTRRKYLYWGNNFDKNMKRLKETKWIPIKDLSTEHIENILLNVENINPLYKKTFQREILYRENKNL